MTPPEAETLHPVDVAARRLGSRAALARAIGVRPQAVQKWISNGIPAERVLAVEAATGVSRQVLRPDLYPREQAA